MTLEPGLQEHQIMWLALGVAANLKHIQDSLFATFPISLLLWQAADSVWVQADYKPHQPLQQLF